jgi:peptidylprolyl isomerase
MARAMRTLRLVVLAGLAMLVASPVLGAQKPRRPRPRTRPAPAAAPAPAAVTTPSGLTCVVTHRANGRRPQKGETVLVHYTGTLTDGTKFDSSHDRNDPIAFALGTGQVIKGWDEGIAMLGVGDTAVLVIPPDLGYGAKGAGGVIPPNATLVFVVELVDIKGPAVSVRLLETLEKRGIDAAVAEYRELKAGGFAGMYASESDMNGLGYQLLGQQKMREAIEILKLNVEDHPSSANAYDSLGEAYMRAGDTPNAITNYEKSLELDPKNANAAEMLKKLRGQP